MGNAERLRLPSFTQSIVGVGSSVPAVVALLAGLAVAPRSAAALPTYSQRENKPCEYCHINPAGGGDRNANGKEYEENGHKFNK
jgi:hypothetical protein